MILTSATELLKTHINSLYPDLEIGDVSIKIDARALPVFFSFNRSTKMFCVSGNIFDTDSFAKQYGLNPVGVNLGQVLTGVLATTEITYTSGEYIFPPGSKLDWFMTTDKSQRPVPVIANAVVDMHLLNKTISTVGLFSPNRIAGTQVNLYRLVTR